MPDRLAQLDIELLVFLVLVVVDDRDANFGPATTFFRTALHTRSVHALDLLVVEVEHAFLVLVVGTGLCLTIDRLVRDRDFSTSAAGANDLQHGRIWSGGQPSSEEAFTHLGHEFSCAFNDLELLRGEAERSGVVVVDDEYGGCGCCAEANGDGRELRWRMSAQLKLLSFRHPIF